MGADSITSVGSHEIQDLVFSGGGAKGALYPGAYKSLCEANVMRNIKTVSGSSAGGLFAAFAGFLVRPEKIAEEMENTSMPNLLGTGQFVITRLKTSLAPFRKDGKPLEEFVSRIIKIATLDNIGDSPENSKITPDLEQKYAKDLQEIRRICTNNDNSKTENQLTFGHLATLRKINPEKFKDLKVTATSVEDGKINVFDADTPNVSIAQACRASASLPVLFRPAAIDNVQPVAPGAKKPKYADGGWVDNIPAPEMIDLYKSEEYKSGRKTVAQLLELDKVKTLLDTISKTPAGSDEEVAKQKAEAEKELKSIKEGLASKAKKDKDAASQLADIEKIEKEAGKNAGYAEEKSLKQKKTLLLAFGKENDKSCQSYQALYSNKKPSAVRNFIEKLVIGIASLKIKGKETYDQHDKRTYAQMQKNYALRTVRLETDLGTADFSKATNQSKQRLLQGYFHTQDYLTNHEVTKEKPGYQHAKFFFEAFKKFEQSERWYNHTSDPNRSQKAERLFNMCVPNQYEKCTPAELDNKIAEYIKIASVERGGTEVSSNTRSMKAFIETLNSPNTPTEIKQSCLKALGTDLGQDKQAYTNYKFKKEDFDEFIRAHKSESLKQTQEVKALRKDSPELAKKTASATWKAFTEDQKEKAAQASQHVGQKI